MIALLQRYNVGKRLSFAFGTLILLSCALVVAGLSTLAQARQTLDTLTNRNMVIVQRLQEMNNAVSVIAVQLRNIVLPTPDEENQRFVSIIEEQGRIYKDAHDKLYTFSAAPAAQAIRAKIDASNKAARALNQQVIDLDLSGRTNEAMPLLLQRAAPATQAWQDALLEYSALQRQRAQEANALATTAIARGRAMLIGGGLAVVLISSVLAWLITRSLVVPLTRATRAAEAIAQGKLDNDVSTQSNDEPGRLLHAMDGMQGQLRNLISAQLGMAKRHEEGQISFRMDAGAFPGDFGSMANDTNALVASHIKVKMQTLHLIERYAIGDLSEDMPQLPGGGFNSDSQHQRL
ncbi:MCP four helix bundle domain-containing protein, partial [Xanthomonas oryzae]|uniref:MCP four helix bundle domain-containing protein n=1 Tax=Xanthomonas oryzae TaxID=347 RepID=UPI000A4F1978